MFDKYSQSIVALPIEPGNIKVVNSGTDESTTRNSFSIDSVCTVSVQSDSDSVSVFFDCYFDNQ